MNIKAKIVLCFVLIYAAFCFLSLNRHSSGKIYTYHSEIWADKAGYNVYLPSLFIYHFEANQFPVNIEEKTGYGFTLDSLSNKVITKYPCGVALMQSPFWLTAHAFSAQKDGFSKFYQKSIDFAGSFYLTLGLFFLFFFIRRKQDLRFSIFLSLAVVLSSGIFYYGIFETGMSHIYSFCSLSAFLYFVFDREKISRNLIPMLISGLLYCVVRPINVIFLLPLICFLFYNKTITINLETIKRTPFSKLLLTLTIILIFCLPQLLYYNYAYGSLVTNSYKNEPFYLPTFGRIAEMLFGPDNGLLIYYPILAALFVYYIANKTPYRSLLSFIFLSYIILYASWWSLSLGCSFGHRAANDIFLILFLPLLISDKKPSRIFLAVLIIAVLINVKFIFSYDTCLHLSKDWDYSEYRSVLFGEFK